MSRKCLVTGGAGFIGSHLVRALLGEGMEVVVLDNLSVGKRENVAAGAKFVEGDIRSSMDVTRALEGVEMVFHEAARVSIRQSVQQFYEDAEINLMGTLNLLRHCPGSHVRKFIFASSMAVYSDRATSAAIPEDFQTEPLSPYGVSKLAAEKYCLRFAFSHNMDCHVLRYFNTYGPGQALTPYVGVITIFIHALLKGEPPKIFGDGEQRRDFVHVSDIIQANLAVMRSNKPCGIYNVGTGRATSVNEIADLLCQQLAPEIVPVHLPPQPGELRNSIADLTKIQADLGFYPKVNLVDRIGEVIETCQRTLR
jgi:UDP-glucose 4-epimerase